MSSGQTATGLYPCEFGQTATGLYPCEFGQTVTGLYPCEFGQTATCLYPCAFRRFCEGDPVHGVHAHHGEDPHAAAVRHPAHVPGTEVSRWPPSAAVVQELCALVWG